jgi:hypothetical protein
MFISFSWSPGSLTWHFVNYIQGDTLWFTGQILVILGTALPTVVRKLVQCQESVFWWVSTAKRRQKNINTHTHTHPHTHTHTHTLSYTHKNSFITYNIAAVAFTIIIVMILIFIIVTLMIIRRQLSLAFFG